MSGCQTWTRPEQYLKASWNLTQDGFVAGHLCHLYKRVHKTELAVQNVPPSCLR